MTKKETIETMAKIEWEAYQHNEREHKVFKKSICDIHSTLLEVLRNLYPKDRNLELKIIKSVNNMEREHFSNV